MVAALFRKQLLKAATPQLRDALLGAQPGRETEELLFPLFAEYVLAHHGAEILRYRWSARSIMRAVLCASPRPTQMHHAPCDASLLLCTTAYNPVVKCHDGDGC